MPRSSGAHYDDGPALRAEVVQTIQAMAVGDYAPSMADWEMYAPLHLPSRNWIQAHWGWREIVAEAGLLVQVAHARHMMTSALNRPLADNERIPWANCLFTMEYMAALPGGLPVCETPRDLGNGRVAWLIR